MASTDSTSNDWSDMLEAVELALIGIAVACTLYGASVIISGVSTYFLIYERQKVNTSRKFLLTIIAIMFLCDTTFIFLLIAYIIEALFTNKVEQSTQLGIALDVIVKLTYLLSDIVVVWRAWTLASSRYPRARYLLLVCLSASTVTATVAMFEPDDSPLNTSIALAAMLPLTLFVTNVVATSFIGKIAWSVTAIV
ncbi:hypothetical protein BT96DRAFT_938369 [Gymnopus androsaceus JB14]|uniref:G-protein coupled receptors family 1 profile domain-containing protein n=1 Tax=Gymnopus androsaceus JB14 TaxID=1447944 RepID=A0A6A4HQI3_9AGAR|nr:hypothetical protein BT96DRAFT_938369 [Gymnopus androsaceus JB14]